GAMRFRIEFGGLRLLRPVSKCRPEWACSSVVEHCVDIAGVASSILATPTIFHFEINCLVRRSTGRFFRCHLRSVPTATECAEGRDRGACGRRSGLNFSIAVLEEAPVSVEYVQQAGYAAF